jgi:nucleoside-diphosphate-sugar epimerase
VKERVLVTGAHGFIGRQAAPLLVRAGYEVHAVSRRRRSAEGGAIDHALDLFDAGACRALLEEVRPRVLLHLAWNASPGAFRTAPDNLDWVAASLVLTRAFAEAGGRRAVYAGSCAEYDWSQPLLDEEGTPLRPATLYGAAKDALRRLVTASSAAQRLSVAWARLFFVYGPGEPRGRLVADTIAALLAGEPALCSAGTQRRDYLHVEDTARALVELMESGIEGPVNIASGTATAVRDVVLGIARCLGREDLIRLGALAPRAEEPVELRARTDILARCVGFQPRYGLSDGIAETCERARRAAASKPRHAGRGTATEQLSLAPIL